MAVACSWKRVVGACSSPQAALGVVLCKLAVSLAAGAAALWYLADSDDAVRALYCELNDQIHWENRDAEKRTDVGFTCRAPVVLTFSPYGVEFSFRYTWGCVLLLCLTVWLTAPFALVALCGCGGVARSCILTVWPSTTLSRAIGAAITGVVCTGLGWHRYSVNIGNPAALLLCYLAVAVADLVTDLPVVGVLRRWAAPEDSASVAPAPDSTSGVPLSVSGEAQPAEP